MQQFLISALCLCLCLAATSAAASGRDLRVGLSDEYPPLSYIDEDGQRRGFEYELADSLCRRLGRTCVWTFTTQADLVQGLRNGSFDLIFAQRLEPKQEGLLYSTPYYHSRAMCIGRPGGRGPEEAGARIGVYQGSVLVSGPGASGRRPTSSPAVCRSSSGACGRAASMCCSSMIWPAMSFC